MKRDFDERAKTWDQDEARLRVSNGIADAMLKALALDGTETLLDYGTGTGTVALRMLSAVKDVVAADASRGMLEVLEQKVKALGITKVRAVLLDLESETTLPVGVEPDVIVSAMTLHHIRHTNAFVRALFRLLPVGGRVAIADLDREDGGFHPDNTGVHHWGFDREALERQFTDAGFRDVQTVTAIEVNRTTPAGEKRYPIFLLTARK